MAAQKRSADDQESQLPPQLVFLHVRKTGGQALFDLLRKNIGEKQSRWGPLETYSDEYDLFAGHSPQRDIPASSRHRYFISTLRDPIRRIVSDYRYWRSMNDVGAAREGLSVVRLARTLPLREWLAHDDVRPWVDNVMVGHFCSDMEASPAKRLSQSKAAIEKLDFILEQESLEADVIQLQRSLNFRGLPIESVNVTDTNVQHHADSFNAAEVISIDAEAADLLAQLTELDRELLIHAQAVKDEVNDRFADKVKETGRPVRPRRLVPGASINIPGLDVWPRVLAGGWADREDWHAWSDGKESRLEFEISDDIEAVVVKVGAFLPSTRKTLLSRWRVNGGEALDVVFLGGDSTYEVTGQKKTLVCSALEPVPVRLDIPGTGVRRVNVEIEIPEAISGEAMGINTDTRQLGIALYNLSPVRRRETR